MYVPGVSASTTPISRHGRRRNRRRWPVIRRLAIVTAWLLVGEAVWLTIFWGLLHVPESSVWMLGLSAVLALALVAFGGAVLAGGSAAWDLTRPPVAALSGSVRYVRRRSLAVLLFGAIWWVDGRRSSTGTPSIAGQIDAWVIARTGRPNARGIHFAIFWLTMTVRWSIGLTLASSRARIAHHHRPRDLHATRAGSSPLWSRRGGWRSRSGSSCWSRFRGTWWTGARPNWVGRGALVRRREAQCDCRGDGGGLGPRAPRGPRSHREYSHRGTENTDDRGLH